jgi:hypothetical protein
MRSPTVLLSTEDPYLARELARQAASADIHLTTLASRGALESTSIGAVILDMDQHAIHAELTARLGPFVDRPLIVVASAGCRDIHEFCKQHGAAHLELRPVSPMLMVRVRGLLRGKQAALDASPSLSWTG